MLGFMYGSTKKTKQKIKESKQSNEDQENDVKNSFLEKSTVIENDLPTAAAHKRTIDDDLQSELLSTTLEKLPTDENIIPSSQKTNSPAAAEKKCESLEQNGTAAEAALKETNLKYEEGIEIIIETEPPSTPTNSPESESLDENGELKEHKLKLDQEIEIIENELQTSTPANSLETQDNISSELPIENVNIRFGDDIDYKHLNKEFVTLIEVDSPSSMCCEPAHSEKELLGPLSPEEEMKLTLLENEIKIKVVLKEEPAHYSGDESSLEEKNDEITKNTVSLKEKLIDGPSELLKSLESEIKLEVSLQEKSPYSPSDAINDEFNFMGLYLENFEEIAKAENISENKHYFEQAPLAEFNEEIILDEKNKEKTENDARYQTLRHNYVNLHFNYMEKLKKIVALEERQEEKDMFIEELKGIISRELCSKKKEKKKEAGTFVSKIKNAAWFFTGKKKSKTNKMEKPGPTLEETLMEKDCVIETLKQKISAQGNEIQNLYKAGNKFI